MRTIENFVVAPTRQGRMPKVATAQELQTTLMGMIGHDLRQSLHVIQGTYALLRSRLDDLPQHAWLDRGERAVSKLTEQFNCLVDAFYLAERADALEMSSIRLGRCSGGCDTRMRMRLCKKASTFGQPQRTPVWQATRSCLAAFSAIS
jgi:two-component system phosphate regulon sensor histidine kinase PhoR